MDGRHADIAFSVTIDLSRPFGWGLQCHAELVCRRGGTVLCRGFGEDQRQKLKKFLSVSVSGGDLGEADED